MRLASRFGRYNSIRRERPLTDGNGANLLI
ncbi:Uncharacterised protein [Escherichia coli]|nr:Uncharacterised protein [Escherichia coli]